MGCRLALVGANTSVGELFVEYIDKKKNLLDELVLLASDPYETDPVIFQKRKVLPQDIDEVDFSKIDIVIFADDEQLINQYAQKAQQNNVFVIDCALKSGDDQLPAMLVVPEINAENLGGLSTSTILRNPSSASIFLSLILNPLIRNYDVTDVNVCCHLPAVHLGQAGVEELVGQTARLLNGMPVESTVFSQQLAFSLLPESSSPEENGYTQDELLLTSQVSEIFAGYDYAINVSCIQVPVFYAQSQIITVTTQGPVTVKGVAGLLSQSSGIKVVSNNKLGPTAIKSAAGKDDLYVGRIRQLEGQDNQISLWTVGETLRKGSAANSVQIAEILIKSYL
ncbi:MAG: aspartate-semialdehyde dehydrogenase [Cellvibrionaceae bacterium]